MELTVFPFLLVLLHSALTRFIHRLQKPVPQFNSCPHVLPGNHPLTSLPALCLTLCHHLYLQAWLVCLKDKSYHWICLQNVLQWLPITSNSLFSYMIFHNLAYCFPTFCCALCPLASYPAFHGAKRFPKLVNTQCCLFCLTTGMLCGRNEAQHVQCSAWCLAHSIYQCW